MARIGRGIEGALSVANAVKPGSNMRTAPAAKSNQGPRQEKKVDLKTPGLVGHDTLGKATQELKMQHPQGYADCGPHHGGGEHLRHMPLAGLKPSTKE